MAEICSLFYFICLALLLSPYINQNYLVIFPHRRNTTVSVETYPLFTFRSVGSSDQLVSRKYGLESCQNLFGFLFWIAKLQSACEDNFFAWYFSLVFTYLYFIIFMTELSCHEIVILLWKANRNNLKSFHYCEFFFFQPNLAVYGNLANVRKGGESEAPPPIPAYTVDKPQPRLALFDVHSVFLFIRCPC